MTNKTMLPRVLDDLLRILQHETTAKDILDRLNAIASFRETPKIEWFDLTDLLEELTRIGLLDTIRDVNRTFWTARLSADHVKNLIEYVWKLEERNRVLEAAVKAAQHEHTRMSKVLDVPNAEEQ